MRLLLDIKMDSMRKLFFFLFTVIFLLNTNTAHATHALGGDLIYTQVGANTFNITLKLYRDCNGIPLYAFEDIEWHSSCGSGVVTAFRNGYTDITPTCPGLPTACQSGSGTIGIEEHVYTTTVNIPSGCTDIVFDYTLCCRNYSITTLANPGSENIYLSASYTAPINTLNNSPVFNNYPTPIVCVNQPVIYNHGVYDPDGDSLYFSASDCYEGYNDPVEYLPGFSGLSPLTTSNPIQIDPNTGAISFTPSAQQVGVMCILVEEFRNGVKIGSTLRDIQFNVTVCANVPPTASGINNTAGIDSLDFVTSICANSQICFDLSFSDAESQMLSIDWNQEIANSTFQIFNNNTLAPTATFCWTPQSSDIGLRFFSVNVADEACPIVGSSTYTYSINVVNNQGIFSLNAPSFVCNGIAEAITLNGSSSLDSIYWTPSPNLVQVNDTLVMVSPSTAEIFTATTFFNGICPVSQSTLINVNNFTPVVGNINTDDLCSNGLVTLTGSGASNYSWNNGVLDNVAFTPPFGVTEYILTGYSSNGCPSFDTVVVVFNPNAISSINPISPICFGETITLSSTGVQNVTWSNGVLDNIAFVPPLGTTTYTMTGSNANGCIISESIDVIVNTLPNVSIASSSDTVCNGDSVSLIASGASNYSWNNGLTNGQNFIPAQGQTDYTVIATDINGCINTLLTTITSLPPVTITIAASDTEVCAGQSIILSASGSNSFTWSNGISNGISFTPPLGTNIYSVISFNSSFMCHGSDSIEITVNGLPEVTAQTSSSIICEGDSIILSGSGAANYSWNNEISNGAVFVPAAGTATYFLTGTDTNGCSDSDSIEIISNSLPEISVLSSGNNICETEFITLNGLGGSLYSWSNSIEDGVSFSPPLGITSYTLFGIDSNGCSGQDSVIVTVYPQPNIGIIASDTTVCLGESITLWGTGGLSYTWDNEVVNGQSYTPSNTQNTYTVVGIDNNGCLSSESITVISPNSIVFEELEDVTICDVYNHTLSSNSSYVQNYEWNIVSNGLLSGLENNPVFSGANSSALSIYEIESGEYTFQLLMTGFCGEKMYDTVKLTINESTPVDVLKDTTLCMQDNNTIFAEIEGENFIWNDGTEGQYLNPNHSGMYAVSFEELYTGCQVSDSLYIDIENCSNECAIVFPTGFSPNQDGVNDYFRLINSCEIGFSNYQCTIYDRWGQVIYMSDDSNAGWNGFVKGQKAEMGVYSYSMSYTSEISNDIEYVQGNVTLIL
tara:strand:+ start:429 stop:4145 length:3717 start_codon:yes stop_codon:yes gene_type:complete